MGARRSCGGARANRESTCQSAIGTLAVAVLCVPAGRTQRAHERALARSVLGRLDVVALAVQFVSFRLWQMFNAPL